MDFEETKAELYRIFPELVIECNLSPNEAMAYVLTQIMDFRPTEAAGFITELTGRAMSQQNMSNSILKAKIKMGNIQRSRLQRFFVSRNSHRRPVPLPPAVGAQRERYPARNQNERPSRISELRCS